MLLIASGDDVLAHFFGMSLNQTLWGFRVAAICVPPIVGLLTCRVCDDLQKVPERRRLRQPARVMMTDTRAYVASITASEADGNGRLDEPGEGEPIEPTDVVLVPAEPDWT